MRADARRAADEQKSAITYTLARAATAAEEGGVVAGRTRHAEETAVAAAKTAAKAALTNRTATAATPSARPVAHHVSYATQDASGEAERPLGQLEA